MSDTTSPPAPVTAPADELAALHDGAACCAPGRRALVSASGDDVLPWLERLCSNPVGELPAGALVRAVLMDGKGKTRSDLTLFRSPVPDDDAVLLDLPAEPLPNLLRLLDMYIIKDKVTLADRSKELHLLLLAGPRAAEVLAAAGLPSPGEGEVAPTPDAGGVHAVLPTRRAGVPGFDLVVTKGAEPGVLMRLEEHGAKAVSPDAVETARILAGVPRFETDLADGVIPLEAHLGDHVSITKGCYPGQEVVARILNLGSVARKLVRLSAPGRLGAEQGLVPGGELQGTGEQAGKPAGTLTSVAHDPLDDRTVALGYVRRASWSSGSRVQTVPPGDAEPVIFDVTALDT